MCSDWLPVAALEPDTIDITDTIDWDPIPEVANDRAGAGDTDGGLVVVIPEQ